jgi:hypothetical protein
MRALKLGRNATVTRPPGRIVAPAGVLAPADPWEIRPMIEGLSTAGSTPLGLCA